MVNFTNYFSNNMDKVTNLKKFPRLGVWATNLGSYQARPYYQIRHLWLCQRLQKHSLWKLQQAEAFSFLSMTLTIGCKKETWKCDVVTRVFKYQSNKHQSTLKQGAWIKKHSKNKIVPISIELDGLTSTCILW